MYIKSTTYPVMENEPHLGSITEHELIAKKYELEDFILAEVERDHYIQAEYEICDIFKGTSVYREAADHVDIEAVEEYLDSCEIVDCKVLYKRAGIRHRSER